MATIKANPSYRPDSRDINMFLNDLKKSAFTDEGGYKRLLKQEYPILTNEEVERYVKNWIKRTKKES